MSVFVRKQRINEDEGQHEASSARFDILRSVEACDR